MAEWMRHGPKDVVETDDDTVHMTEQELCHHIKSQLDFGKKVVQHLTSSYKKLVRLEQRRREARSRELKERWQEKQRLVDEKQKEVASRMCCVCSKKIQELEKGQREQSRSRSPPPRQLKLGKKRTGFENIENEGGQNRCNDGKSHNVDCGP